MPPPRSPTTSLPFRFTPGSSAPSAPTPSSSTTWAPRTSARNGWKTSRRAKSTSCSSINMLLTGFDAARLEEALPRPRHQGAQPPPGAHPRQPHLQAASATATSWISPISRPSSTRPTRPTSTNSRPNWATNSEHYSDLFKSAEEIVAEIEAIKDALFHFDTANAEIFSQQITAIRDRSEMREIIKALERRHAASTTSSASPANTSCLTNSTSASSPSFPPRPTTTSPCSTSARPSKTATTTPTSSTSPSRTCSSPSARSPKRKWSSPTNSGHPPPHPRGPRRKLRSTRSGIRLPARGTRAPVPQEEPQRDHPGRNGLQHRRAQ